MTFTRPRAVLFDLDGTLTDPAPGLIRCLTHAFAAVGLPIPGRTEMLAAIGPPWEDYLAASMGVPHDLVDEVIAAYRSEYAGGGMFEADLFEGVPQLLADLVDEGFELALATSKPLPSAELILDHFGLTGYFTALGGATMDGSRRHKHDVMDFALDLLGHRDAVMVGDRKYDVLGAAHHGIACIGVTWGHAEDGEFDDHPPAAYAAHPADVLALVTR